MMSAPLISNAFTHSHQLCRHGPSGNPSSHPTKLTHTHTNSVRKQTPHVSWYARQVSYYLKLSCIFFMMPTLSAFQKKLQLCRQLLSLWRLPACVGKLGIKSYTTTLSINLKVRSVYFWSIPVCLICHSELQQASLSDKLTFLRK